MVERKVYKTKLCVLYQKGHCHRHSCNFAHGDAERRRFSGPLEGRRDYRGRDLREKLNRRYSPPRRYPLRRDISGRHASRGDSPSGSLEKSDRRRRKRQQPDGQSDLSESLQTSNETQYRLKEKCVSYDSKHTLKIRQLQSEIKKLDDRKKGLEVYLEDRTLEAEKLALKVEELEVQLFKEKDECKRISSRIKKFIEAHKHLSRLHDEVKRSDAQLRKLGEKLFSSASASGDDLSMNIVTDGEAVGCPIIYGEMRKNMSPRKKRSRMNPVDGDVPGQGNPSEGAYAEMISLENNHSRRNVLQVQSSNDKKEKADIIRTSGFQDAEGEDRPVRGEDCSTNTALVEKPKGIFEVLPSTGMAAHAEDEDVEVVEIEEKHEMYENASVAVAGEAVFDVKKFTSLPPLPPLPIYKDSYSQLKGQDENVDIDGVDEETTEVDIV
ncbi:unnamed protein product [Cuscuta campestris]|uniref:C3H1-type domain-containing protein n=1 Tax=Cuscuta campestris TaxID=132261 RepID=A0A484N2R5_9ASTE|nr:unnamed protein product [Cuscuta campestris]